MPATNLLTSDNAHPGCRRSKRTEETPKCWPSTTVPLPCSLTRREGGAVLLLCAESSRPRSRPRPPRKRARRSQKMEASQNRKTQNRTGGGAPIAHTPLCKAVRFSLDAPRAQRQRNRRTTSLTLVRSGNGVSAKPNNAWASTLHADCPDLINSPSSTSSCMRINEGTHFYARAYDGLDPTCQCSNAGR